jgi:hypothetical protein
MQRFSIAIGYRMALLTLILCSALTPLGMAYVRPRPCRANSRAA